MFRLWILQPASSVWFDNGQPVCFTPQVHSHIFGVDSDRSIWIGFCVLLDRVDDAIILAVVAKCCRKVSSLDLMIENIEGNTVANNST